MLSHLDPPEDQAALPGATTSMRPMSWLDPLYGNVRIAGWAAALLTTPPFRRLAGISLSNVPGELLFSRPFPTRLDHARGVYHLARLARPRDRTLQAAALAHDLGHGPFGHLTEPLMRERFGCDHEERAARQLDIVRASLSRTALRHLEWLDWDAVAALIVGQGDDERGRLLNGRLDYDNIDNVARFLVAANLGEPGYSPVALARALRVMPQEIQHSSASAQPERNTSRHEPTYVLLQAADDAVGWQAARMRTYGYLHGDHPNVALHAMLRKAVESAFVDDRLPRRFFDMTDAEAMGCLIELDQGGTALLARRVRAGTSDSYACIWEADMPSGASAHSPLNDWRARLSLETDLAHEAGLAPHEVILEATASRAGRALPPLSVAGRPGTLRRLPEPMPAHRPLRLFVSPDAPRDYTRRLRSAAERRLGGLVIGAGHAAGDTSIHNPWA